MEVQVKKPLETLSGSMNIEKFDDIAASPIPRGFSPRITFISQEPQESKEQISFQAIPLSPVISMPSLKTLRKCFL